MWMMIMIGVALAAVFVFALRSQINAYRLGQAEEQLKQKLDQYSAQQKFLTLDLQRSMNASESERAGREGGLNQLKLDPQSSLRGASMQKVVQKLSGQPSEPSGAPQSGQNDDGQGVPRAVKPADDPPGAQPNRPVGRPELGAKAARAAAAAKAVKAGAAKPKNVAKSNVAKAGKTSTRGKANASQAKKRGDDRRLASRSRPR
jgi:hypothetical protein